MTLILICTAASVYHFQPQAQTDAYQNCKPDTVQTVDVPPDLQRQIERARIEAMKQEGKG